MKWEKAWEEFLCEYIPGHTVKQTNDEFERRFGFRLTKGQLNNRRVRLGLQHGTNGGRFKKGQASYNKGKTWDEMGLSKEKQEKIRANCFKKGNLNGYVKAHYKPIGYERLSKEGFVEVKVKYGLQDGANDNFRMKHHVVWEQANGREIPSGCRIVFADRDRLNLDPENLVCVSKSDWALITTGNIGYHDRESLLAAIDIARLRRKIREVRLRPRVCVSCGCEYKPHFDNQRTCKSCVAAGYTRGRRLLDAT